MAKPKKMLDKKDYNEQSQELCVHFNTKEHRISLEDFIMTVSSYNIIANNIGENIFGIKNGIKVYILPPKEGSFDLSMLVWLSSVAVSGIVASLANDCVKGFVRGVTKKLNPKKYPKGFDIQQGAEILGDTITGFMLETTDNVNKLDKFIPKGNNIDASKKAKSNFYNMCSRNKEINSLGFSHENKSELKRSDFVARGVPPVIKSLPVKIELKELIIVKPVNVEEDLQWDLKDKNTNESLTAKMLDEDFKTMLFKGMCPQRQYDTPDIITALVEYHDKLKDGKEIKSEYLITDVYKFNKKILKPIPKGLKINRRKRITELDKNKQLKLFKPKKKNK